MNWYVVKSIFPKSVLNKGNRLYIKPFDDSAESDYMCKKTTINGYVDIAHIHLTLKGINI